MAPIWSDETFEFVDFANEDSDLDIDPMAYCVWATEMCWRAKCAGSAAALTYSIAVAGSALGGIFDHDRRLLTWYGWDAAGYLARTHELIEANQIGEFVSWFAKLTTIHAPAPGPLLPLAEHAIAFLDLIPESTAKNQLLVALARRDEISQDHRRLLEDAVLAAPPRGKGGKPLRELQVKLRTAKEIAWAGGQPLPTDAAALTALWDRATTDERESRVLARLVRSAEPEHAALVVELVLAKARAGAATPAWSFWDIRSPDYTACHEYALDHREFFALCGPLAAWLVERWRSDEAHAETLEDNLERRRRDGEVYVDLPADIAALVRDKLFDRATVEYAKRYELAIDRARKVIDANR
ncbi:MAG: hypothetical protein ABI678_10205 [Kofleriaceae bacterium]